MSASMNAVLKAMTVFSALLLVGTFIRAKVKIFQKLYIPACVIAGFLGLILGPNGFNVIKLSEDTMAVASAMPGVFIIPVLTSIPMCMKLGGGMKGKGGKTLHNIIFMALIMSFFPFFQFFVGLLSNTVCSGMGAKSFPTLGLDMAMGFMGGHGMAASLGSMLQAAGDPNWEVAQALSITAATVGLIAAIICGVILINYATKKGYTTQIKKASESDKATLSGIYDKNSERPSLGKQTTVANSIETLTIHLALMLLAVGGGYLLQKLCALTGISFISSMATWFYGMVVMFALWLIIRKLKLDYLFDETVKNKINGMLSDFLIVAAITSIPLSVVAEYWVPLLVECILGLALTVLFNWFLCKNGLYSNWFETSLGSLGSNLGVFVTGILLIKMADPELKTEALTTYSLGYSLPVFSMILISFAVIYTYEHGTVSGMFFNLLLSIAWLVGMLFMILLRRRALRKEAIVK